MRAAARLSIVALGFALVHVPLAIGDPSDPFSAALPSRDTKAPEPMRGASESSVDEQVGAATYRYPIEVPPGRRNVEPELALTYSSGAPLRGGVAVGWSLDLPVIERDPDFPNEVRYRSTLSGSSGRLVPSPQDPGLGTRYRAEVDDSFFRYDLDLGSGYWTVRSPDGTVYEFWQVADGRALLTRQVDAFGNEMGYAYTRVTFNGHAEYVPAAIEYTSNWANNVAPHARVVFNYAADQSCGGIPLGASVDYHFGKKRISGSKRLQSIQTWAKNTPTSAYRLVRQYALSYDQAELSCSASALRYLTQLDVTAYNPQGVGSVAPSVRLGYGPKQRTLSRTLQPSWSPHEVGTHLGAKSGFLDVNGDGRADYISVVTRADGCYIEWRSGFGDGNFSLVPASFKLPSAAWRAGSPGGHESCTLSGQVASRPGVSNRTYCSPRSVYVNYQFVDYDGDGRLDILSSLSGDHADARGDFMFNTGIFYFADNGSGGGCPLGTTQHGEVENGVRNCACNSGSTYDSFLGACTSQCAPGESFNAVTGSCSTRDACPSCPSGPQNPGGPLCSPAPQEPQRVGPDYVWYLQRFVGAQLAPLSLASRVYSPMPLPAGGAATTLAQPTTRPNVPTLVDFDGDGWLDVVSLVGGAPTTVPPPIGDLATSRGIYVWRGNGTDRFGPKLLWAFPAGWLQEAERVSTASPGIVISTMTLELRDMNGDGAADIVAQQVPTGQPGTGATIGVAYNMPGGTSPLPNVGTIGGSFTPMTSFEIVSPIARMRNELLEWGGGYVRGWRASLRRLLDVDGDGTAELVVMDPAGSVVDPAVGRVAIPLRGGATSAEGYYGLTAEWEPIESRVRADGWTWSRASDFLDLTGDGLPDALSYSDTGAMTIRTDGLDGPALRLLTTIDNGRGSVTRFDYARSSDSSVVVTMGKSMPQRPVVARITKVSGFGQAEEQTSFIYTQPVLGKASAVDPRAPSFLGFQQVTVARSGQQGPASARTVKSFDYTPLLADRSGRLASELTSRAEGLAQVPVSHKQLTYGARNVGSTSASFTYVADEIDRVCEPTATAEACAAQPPTKTTTQIWSAGLAGAVPQLWLNTETETTVGLQVRFTARTYDVRWSDTIAHVLPAMEQSGAIAVIPVGNGALRYPVPLTRTLTLYSAAGLPEETRTYKDAATYVTTKYSYHSTGMLLTVKRPNEVAANHFASESTRYNEFLLHPTAYVNQGNQYTYVSYDTATGALLSRTGPSYRMTATPGVYVTDRETWSIDGFGRVISRSDSLEPAAGVAGYDFRTVETVQYFDAELPNRRLTSRLRDPAANTWVRDEARLDGSGRVIEEIARRQLAGEPDARKLYTYDAGGALARIDETSPASGAGGALVATVFTRDGVGRPLTITRPDGSGETIRYAGLDTEVTEQSSTDPGARTTLRNDGFAELVEVHEHDNPLAGQTAITRYQRDALGRMSTIVDADGGTTMIAHDWRGARAAVTRGARAWRYTYDANGNMIEQSEPVPTGGTPADYKMVTTYDRLNRPMTVTPPTRGMSAARLAQLGLGVTTYAYDGNGFVGKPHQITLPFGTITLAYEANGRVARETRNLALSEGVSVTTTQWVERRYDALGNPTSTRWDDGTEWRYTHDTRGQVSDVLWRPATGGKLVTLAHYDRQATGQPTRRTSEYPQQRTWSYDVLGRVSYDRVFNTATNASYHERTYGYDGFGSLRSVQGATGGMLADATHDFDARHRVIAAQGPLGYDASFSYSGAGNVRTAAVVGASDAPDRDVNYLYSAADPQAVELLSDRTTGAAVGSYVYDAAGNTVQRTIGASTRNFTWGGNGMLREVTGPEGTERYYFGPEAQRMVALGPDGVKVWFGESETSFTNTGAFVRRYHHVASGEPVARSVRSTPTAAHTLELQYADALSNLAVAVNTNGTLTAAFVYGAFGELVGATGAADHRRAFNGKEHDVATGLRHYGYRSYDPVSLRWASADPLFRFAPDAAWTTPQHANLYAFSLNNPLQYMDPDGRRPGYTRSWSGDAPKNATEWTYSDVAKCPKKGVCQIDVIHDHRLDATHFDLGGVHVVGYTMIRTMFTITVVDGVVQNEPEVTIPYDQDVYRETVGTRGGRIVDYEVAKLAETTVGWTSTLTITGNKVSLAIEASGGSKQQQSGTTMHLDGSVEKIVGLAGGANKSSGESRDIHSGSRGKTGLLFNVQTVSPGEWNRLATERMEGPFIGEPRL